MSKKKFLLSSIKDFKTTGSWLPSQKYLVNNLTSKISKKDKLIVEFGAGEGCVTKSILSKMSKNSKLITFEINNSLSYLLKDKFEKEKNIKIIEDDVKNIEKYIKNKKVDIIISSLPLGNMNKFEVVDILNISKKVLKKDGSYVQYQYLGVDFPKLKKVFGNLKVSWQPLNFPPALVYNCRK